jgi:hypothetical protein
VLFLVLPTAAAILLTIALMNWRVSTYVNGDVTIDRMAFTVGGASSIPISDAFEFRSLTIEKFDRITLTPQDLLVADPAGYQLAEDTFSSNAWTPLGAGGEVVLSAGAEHLHPAVSLTPVRRDAPRGGVLDTLWVQPGAVVTLEVVGSNIVLAVAGQKSVAHVSFRDRFHMHTSYTRITGASTHGMRGDAVSYETSLSDRNPFLEITGRPADLLLVVGPAPEQSGIFRREPIPVATLDLTRQGDRGGRATALVAEGTIGYPDHAAAGPVAVTSTDLVDVDRLARFHIDGISWVPKARGLRLKFRGDAGRMAIGPPDRPRDHRLTMFDRLWEDRRLVALVSIILWVFPTTVGAYQLYRELRGRR